MKILALDVETGGFSADRNALTQLAIVACTISAGTAHPVDTFVRNVRPAPSLLLEDSALEVQGHTRATLLRRPGQLSEAETVEEMKRFFAGLGDGWECAPFVAHSGKFDHSFLDALCRRTATPLPARDVLCTIERHKDLARRHIIAKPENNKLKTLVQQLGFTQNDAHDAGQDALLCALLFAWQDAKLASTQSLIEELTADPVGLVYKHVPADTDGWWTKGPKEYPAKAPEAKGSGDDRKCPSCGKPEATWFKQYRLGSNRNTSLGAIQKFYSCGDCKRRGIDIAGALGLSSDERVVTVGEWKYSTPNTERELEEPQAAPSPSDPKPAASGVRFSCSRELVELHQKAKNGKLPALTGWRSHTGGIEDANRFVTGIFKNIAQQLEDLERINGAVKGVESAEKASS